MKKIFFMAAICLLTASCSNESELKQSDEQQYAQVYVNVGGINMAVEEFPDTRVVTRADGTAAADYSGVAAIDLAFFASDGTLAYKYTQWRSDATTYETFGKFTCQLLFGTYNMVIIARGGNTSDVFNLTSPTEASYTSEFARETFTATQEVKVNSTDALNISATLHRIMTKLSIRSTDNLPSAAAQIRTTYSVGSKSFNPTTGVALDDNGFTVTNTAYKADGKLAVSNYAFLTADEQEATITLEVLDKDENVLNTKTIEAVPLKCNRITTLSGSLFTADASTFSVLLSTDWETEETVTF